MQHRRVLMTLSSFVLALALASCSKQDEQPEVVTAQTVTTVKAQQQNWPHTIFVSGPVAAWEEMQLGVEINGVRVTQLNVDVGQQVKKGQTLLTLDHRTLDSTLRQAQAGLSEAEARLSLARANLARAEQLVSAKYISASQVDELRAARTQAEAGVNTARANRDAAQLQRDFAELRAPADGIISKRLVQPGQVVGAGVELLRLIRDGRLEWRAELPEAELARVKVGDIVGIRTTEGALVEGRIRAVSPGVDATTRTGTIYADLPEPGSLKQGTYVEGRIKTGEVQAITVPAQSIVQRDGHSFVFTVNEKNIAQRIRIETGETLNRNTAVREGLKAGTAVVLDGAGFLSDGDHVRIVPATTTPAPTTGTQP